MAAQVRRAAHGSPVSQPEPQAAAVQSPGAHAQGARALLRATRGAPAEAAPHWFTMPSEGGDFTVLQFNILADVLCVTQTLTPSRAQVTLCHPCNDIGSCGPLFVYEYAAAASLPRTLQCACCDNEQ